MSGALDKLDHLIEHDREPVDFDAHELEVRDVSVAESPEGSIELILELTSRGPHALVVRLSDSVLELIDAAYIERERQRRIAKRRAERLAQGGSALAAYLVACAVVLVGVAIGIALGWVAAYWAAGVPFAL